MAGFWDDGSPEPTSPYIGAFGRLAGRARGSPAGLPIQARDASPFTLTRERVADELSNDPQLQQKLDANTTAEVGTDPAKRRWYQSLTIDRAVQTGKPLADIVNAPDYYPTKTVNATATTGQQPDASIWEGANPANYATGNSSYDPIKGRWVGFAGGPQTSTYGSGRGMELGGIEGQAGLPYARAMGYTGPERTAIGPQGPQGDEGAQASGLLDLNTPPASYPRSEGRKMADPQSLLDYFQPTDPSGASTTLGQALQQRSNSLIGLGLGLMSPAWEGQTVVGNALKGFQSGTAADTAQAKLRENTAERKQAQSNWEKQFAQSTLTPYQKMQADLAKAAGTPQEQQVRDFYRTQLDAGPPPTREIFDPTLGRNIVQEWDSHTKQFKTSTMPTTNAPGAGTGAPGATQDQPLLPARKPLSAHEQTAIDEADKSLMANRGVIGTLQDAKRLSKTAFSGLYPMQRAEVGSQIPDVPFLKQGGQAAKDTLMLHNAVISQAVDQLKATFGGNPSEGERKILLDLAGSMSAPDEVRQAIYDKAISAAQQKLQLNQQRSQEIRGGTYYNPGGGVPSPAPAQTFPPPSDAAVRALKSNPQKRDQFDEKFGPGAAMRALRGG